MKTSLSPYMLWPSVRRQLTALVLIAALLYLPSCKDDEKIFKEGPIAYEAQVAYDWIGLQLVLAKKTPGFTPPVAARAYGYTGLGLYEAMRYGMEGFRSMAGQVNGFNAATLPEAETHKPHHWGLVANVTMATLMRGLYPNTTDSLKAAITALESEYNATYADETSSQLYERSVELATNVGNAVLEYAASDGQSQAYLNNFPASYNPPTGFGFWRPTPSAFSPAMLPYWGDVRPFVSANVSSAVLPPAPLAFDTTAGSPCMVELTETLNYVDNPTSEQVVIAKYWSDDPGKTFTPSGHSVSIMMQVLQNENAKLDEVAVTYAQMGMALHDAFISCWKAKYIHNYIRPVTAIRDLGYTTWTPLLNTPPFPEYPSGHSVQSGAACLVLTQLFGANYAFTDRSHENRTDIDGTPRSFTSFEDFAMEAAESRLYGGIHFRKACEEGLTQGIAVGNNIHNLKWND